MGLRRTLDRHIALIIMFWKIDVRKKKKIAVEDEENGVAGCSGDVRNEEEDCGSVGNGKETVSLLENLNKVFVFLRKPENLQKLSF